MNVLSYDFSAKTQRTKVKALKSEGVDNLKEATVINIRAAKKAQEAARQELVDYLMWTLKHDMDPHRIYEDPIEVFRAEVKSVVGLD